MGKNKLSTIIEKHQESHVDSKRDYIGASIIGSECLRQIWYEYKGYPSEGVPAKTRRTWAIGKRLEGLVIEWLVEAGVEVETNDITWYSAKIPLFQGHFDGIITNCKNRAILEIKTAKDASFKVFVSKGVKVWNPQYYAQIQSYMGMSGIFSTYILVLNKDNSEISDELVLFDPTFYINLECKALIISKADSPPPRINGSPLWFKCKLCKFNKECHQ